jgi:hypothetical protein
VKYEDRGVPPHIQCCARVLCLTQKPPVDTEKPHMIARVATVSGMQKPLNLPVFFAISDASLASLGPRGRAFKSGRLKRDRFFGLKNRFPTTGLSRYPRAAQI